MKKQHLQIQLPTTGAWRYVRKILPSDLSVSIYPPHESIACEIDRLRDTFPLYKFRVI